MENIHMYLRDVNKFVEFETQEELPIFFLDKEVYEIYRFIDYYIKMQDIIQELEYKLQLFCYGSEIKKYRMHNMIKIPFFFSFFNLCWESVDSEGIDAFFSIYQQSFLNKKYVIFIWVRMQDNFSF